MSNIPCKNCITFAICNAHISDDCPYTDVAFNLIPKCSLIENYTKWDPVFFKPNSYDDERITEYITKRVLQITKFFKSNAVYPYIRIYEVNKEYTLCKLYNICCM